VGSRVVAVLGRWQDVRFRCMVDAVRAGYYVSFFKSSIYPEEGWCEARLLLS
jgi:hypothetical protein